MIDNFATIKYRGKTHQVNANQPVLKAIKLLKIPRSAYLITREGTLITEDEIMKPGDLIEMLPVISGG
jgi:sulfur carrier protein ThiS